jgi:hypothetical protein
MSVILYGVINSTVGLLCSKLRDYTAERLNEGDINDEKCRQIIVRELDNIKSKLDGLARKDLLASLSFFKEGVTRLYTTRETSCDKSSTSQVSIEDECEVEGATAMGVERFPVTQLAECDAIQRASELSELFGNLSIASGERYKSAKKSFEEAKRLATEAFNNVALSTEDRLMASKLRIASRILECLNDPEASVRDCLLYLKELQDLPAVQEMFSVWRNSDKGITSRLRARFNRKKRTVNIESIQMINALLVDFATKHTTMKMALFDWPMIKLDETTYHPILQDPVVLNELDKKKVHIPWIWEFSTVNIDYDGCELNSKGEILSRIEDPSREDGLEILRRSGECEIFCIIPSEDDRDIRNELCCFAVGENDNVYIVIKIPSRCAENTQYKLLILDANAKIKADRFIDIEEPLSRSQMSVTKDGMIVIYCDHKKTMYICDSTNARPDYEFPLPYKNLVPDETYQFNFTVSNKNEIIYTLFKDDKYTFFMYIITMDGKPKRKVEIPITAPLRKFIFVMNVVFDHVNEEILVSYHREKSDSVSDDNGEEDNDDDGGDDSNIDYLKQPAHTKIFTFSNSGELRSRFKIPGWYDRLTSHPNGHTALVDEDEAIMLRMK